MTKAGGFYQNGSWDLVDACREKRVDAAAVRDEDLPEAMRKMTADQRKTYVEAKARERAEVQQEIGAVGVQREAFIREGMKAQGLKDDTAFDNAVRGSIRKQAAQKGFTFEK